jgi:hypothetical protein
MNASLPDEKRKKYTKIFWGFALFPFLFVVGLIFLQSEDDLPPVSMLDNPPELIVFGEFNGFIAFEKLSYYYSNHSPPPLRTRLANLQAYLI